MNDINNSWAAVQNGVILEIFPTREEALSRVKEEMQRDFLSIFMKRKLRKIFKKSGNISLHDYSICKISEVEKVK